MKDITQDWVSLKASDTIEVTEPGRPAYSATVDTKTDDSRVIWILTKAGTRHAFDAREGVEIRTVDPLP